LIQLSRRRCEGHSLRPAMLACGRRRRNAV
jgi:hypothetical protein